jgi:hypothetical protein
MKQEHMHKDVHQYIESKAKKNDFFSPLQRCTLLYHIIVCFVHSAVKLHRRAKPMLHYTARNNIIGEMKN